MSNTEPEFLYVRRELRAVVKCIQTGIFKIVLTLIERAVNKMKKSTRIILLMKFTAAMMYNSIFIDFNLRL